MKIKIFVATVLLFAMAPLAWSQGTYRYGANERADTWDFSIEVVYQGSESLSGEGGSSLKIDDDWGFGFNFGYNFTNHWALGFEMNFLDPRYHATAVSEDTGELKTFSHTSSMFNGLVKGTYNILKGPVTPFIDLSVGFTYIDSNVADRPPTTGCWWHPYWGYICNTYWSTYDETIFNYGGGLGVRWDVTRDIFLRASYNAMNAGTSNLSDPTFYSGRLEIGWSF